MGVARVSQGRQQKVIQLQYSQIRLLPIAWARDLIMIAGLKTLDELEIGLCLRINRISARPRVRHFFVGVSKLGDWPFWAAAGLAIIGVQGYTSILPVLQMAITGAIGAAIYKILKVGLVRHRPYVSHGDIRQGTRALDQGSFPSGHTLHAVSFTMMISAVEPLLNVVTIPFALLVAASRVVLGLHYPSDVAAGAVLGACLATASITLM